MGMIIMGLIQIYEIVGFLKTLAYAIGAVSVLNLGLAVFLLIRSLRKHA